MTDALNGTWQHLATEGGLGKLVLKHICSLGNRKSDKLVNIPDLDVLTEWNVSERHDSDTHVLECKM